MAYDQVTLAELRTLLAERVESVPFWDASDETYALNEALKIWNMLTGYWKKRVIVDTVPGQHYYTVCSTMLYQLRMQWGSYPMDLSSWTDLDYGHANWEGETAGDPGVPDRPIVFAPVGLNRFAIWPADSSVNQIAVDSVRETPVLTASDDFVDIGQEELAAILGYALHYLAFKEGGSRFAATSMFYQQFMQAAAEKNGRLNASTFYRNAMGLDLNRNQFPMKRAIENEPPPGQARGTMAQRQQPQES